MINNSLKNLPCQKWRHLINDSHNSLFTLTKHNGRSKLQNLLKHDFTNKPTKKRKNLIIYPNKFFNHKKFNELKQWWIWKNYLLWLECLFFGLNSSFKTSLIPFLSAIYRLLKPNDAFLHICLSRLDRNIF
jgi:hypothetical protein